jgi:hypothetical protein
VLPCPSGREDAEGRWVRSTGGYADPLVKIKTATIYLLLGIGCSSLSLGEGRGEVLFRHSRPGTPAIAGHHAARGLRPSGQGRGRFIITIGGTGYFIALAIGKPHSDHSYDHNK